MPVYYKTNEYKGFVGKYYYEELDRCYYGSISEDEDAYGFAGNLFDIQRNFEKAVDDFINDGGDND